MKAYRLRPNDGLPEKIQDYLWDIDEDFTNKDYYIAQARKETKRVNKIFNTNYKWTDLFEEPTDIGYRYCTKCRTYYWADDHCECGWI